MTLSEKAYLKRLIKRNDAMFSALCIVKTWLTFPYSAETTCYQIGELIEKAILAEKSARVREGNNT